MKLKDWLPLAISILLVLSGMFASWYDLKTKVAVLQVTQELNNAGLAARLDALERHHKH